MLAWPGYVTASLALLVLAPCLLRRWYRLVLGGTGSCLSHAHGLLALSQRKEADADKTPSPAN